ncbi:hypothetical protein [Nocardia asteroides]|uniref:hypothetical protein n=1 Tax=Nocardia asteroides TaxID=1824 RepID=UPI001E464F9B|nr:hypothetical protein [Nocardia asteroides]UGT54807.1 hypothetical protein LTT85_30085 [Nocardia asteroides]
MRGIGMIGAATAVAATAVLGTAGTAAAVPVTTNFAGAAALWGWSMNGPGTDYVTVTATTGVEPGQVSFGVANVVPYKGDGSPWLRARVQWLNVNTGATGIADVPYIFPCTDPAQCPVGPVVANTGPGQIVAGVYSVAVGGNIGPSVTVMPGYGTVAVS